MLAFFQKALDEGGEVRPGRAPAAALMHARPHAARMRPASLALPRAGPLGARRACLWPMLPPCPARQVACRHVACARMHPAAARRAPTAPYRRRWACWCGARRGRGGTLQRRRGCSTPARRCERARRARTRGAQPASHAQRRPSQRGAGPVAWKCALAAEAPRGAATGAPVASAGAMQLPMCCSHPPPYTHNSHTHNNHSCTDYGPGRPPAGGDGACHGERRGLLMAGHGAHGRINKGSLHA